MIKSKSKSMNIQKIIVKKKKVNNYKIEIKLFNYNIILGNNFKFNKFLRNQSNNFEYLICLTSFFLSFLRIMHNISIHLNNF